MTKSLINACFLTCALWSVDTHGQTRPPNPLDRLEALQMRYSDLAARYQKRCEAAADHTERNSLLIEQGGALAHDPTMGPMAGLIAMTLRSLQQQLTDEVCANAADYADLSRAIENILEEDKAEHR
jgi:hypothetical protein